MYKKILFPTCLTDYCDHIFRFALNLAKENDAKLWIYHGLGGPQGPKNEDSDEAIQRAEAHMEKAYAEQMTAEGFTAYMINTTRGETVREIVGLARNAKIDVIVMGTSTQTPMDTGDGTYVGNTLGPVASDVLLRAPCPVLIVPPALLPGLAKG